MSYCKICGELDCKKHSFLIGKALDIKEIAGSSPPEVFVGRWNYPNVYAGILTPQEYGNTTELSSAKIWHDQKFPIPKILDLRGKLVYGRSQTNIRNQNKIMPLVQEVAMTHKSIATEFTIKKPISTNKENDPRVPLIKNSAEMEKLRLQENPSIKPKVDYLVNDTEVKSANAIIELDKSNIDSSTIMKILSVGLLGLRKNRKLVPTRWSITAVDDTLSKSKLEEIRDYKEIESVQLFNAEYLGNHYEFLLLPEKFSFEVIEISLKNFGVWHDFELFYGRKKYADDVTGAYYANRLALTEYLSKIKRQCNCIVFREIRPEYYAPLGVGILREISRKAFQSDPEKFNTIDEAINSMKTRIKLPPRYFTEKSYLLKNYKKQKRISDFLISNK